MSPVVVENVSKQFRQGDRAVKALAGVSLEVARGQFLAVMGASGSGKSTLLHLMAGLTRPTAAASSSTGRHLDAERSRSHAVPPAAHRAGVSGVQPDPDADGRGKRRAAADARRRTARPAAARRWRSCSSSSA